jgi:hypothetical protein
VVEQLPEHELVCRSEPAWEHREGEAGVEQQPLRALGYRVKCQTSFMILPPVLLQEQPVVIFLLEMVLVSWSLAIDERGGHKDLRGSGRRSVIPYVHGRTKLYCSSLPCLSLFSRPTPRSL